MLQHLLYRWWPRLPCRWRMFSALWSMRDCDAADLISRHIDGKESWNKEPVQHQSVPRAAQQSQTGESDAGLQAYRLQTPAVFSHLWVWICELWSHQPVALVLLARVSLPVIITETWVNWNVTKWRHRSNKIPKAWTCMPLKKCEEKLNSN